ncbi:MAG: large conductance mechanosensitive channel protein MscL [Lancefieldella parvula]
MKKFLEEFKEFIQQGNVMDMAIGIIIGGAFTAIVTSLVNDIINPFIKLISGGGTEVSGLSIPVPGTQNGIDFGAFISAIINFLIIAFIVFCMVKTLNKFMKASKLEKDKEEAVEEVAAPHCPHCLEEVKEGATRCPHCTGEIEGGAHAA